MGMGMSAVASRILHSTRAHQGIAASTSTSVRQGVRHGLEAGSWELGNLELGARGFWWTSWTAAFRIVWILRSNGVTEYGSIDIKEGIVPCDDGHHHFHE